jgi:acyltransferase
MPFDHYLTTQNFNKALSKERIYWIDFAKAYGMFFVFLGHILEAFWLTGYTNSFLPYKFIYSFHIPLFFILSGYISKETKLNFWKYLSEKLIPRLLVPFIFFNVTFILASTLLDLVAGEFNHNLVIGMFWELLIGHPSNVVTWFLLCLFSVKVIDYAVSACYDSKSKKMLVAAGLFVIGWLLTLNYEFLKFNLWFFPEALVAYLFYCFGVVLKSQNWLLRGGAKSDLVGFCVSLPLTLVTFNLNHSILENSTSYTLNMAFSEHGEPLLFLLTALAGSFSMIFLARLLVYRFSLRQFQTWLGVQFIGLNTLIYLGLNGFFFSFNHAIAQKSSGHLPDSSLSILTVSISITYISLLLCMPVVVFLKKFVPRLVGLPKAKQAV